MTQYNSRLLIATQQKKGNTTTKAKVAIKAKAPQKRKRSSSQAIALLSLSLVLRPIVEPTIKRRETRRSAKEARIT